jgi:hypothetical protein
VFPPAYPFVEKRDRGAQVNEAGYERMSAGLACPWEDS